MAVLPQEKVTITLPSHIKDEVFKLKEELHLSMNAIYQTAIAEYVEKKQREQLRKEAEAMVSEYKNNPEILELSRFEEDIHEY
jgi:post-segregation antitoxin (ccd killing protein)